MHPVHGSCRHHRFGCFMRIPSSLLEIADGTLILTGFSDPSGLVSLSAYSWNSECGTTRKTIA
jgi:hypothetical protein